MDDVNIEKQNQLKEKLQYVTKTNRQLTGAIKLLKTNYERIDEENRAFAEENQTLR